MATMSVAAGAVPQSQGCLRFLFVLVDDLPFDQKTSLLQRLDAHIVGIARPLGFGDGVMFNLLNHDHSANSEDGKAGR